MSTLVDNSDKNAGFSPLLSQLIQPLKRGMRKIGISGLKGSAPSFILSLLRQELGKTFLIITPTLRKAEECYSELLFFLGGEEHIFLYPPREELPFETASRHPEVNSQRVEVLHHLMRGSSPVTIVLPITALIPKVVPQTILERYSRRVSVGEEVERDELARTLVKSGYLKVGLVEDRGDYSIRGGIMDVFPPGHETPLRIEFYGDVIESVRQFDVLSQRSFGELADMWLMPVRETILEEDTIRQVTERIRERSKQMMLPSHKTEELVDALNQFHISAETERLLPYLYPSLDTMFDYLSKDSLIFLHDFDEIQREHDYFLMKAEESCEKCVKQEQF
ncbi:MAG: hypothetical protein JRJ00_16070, partial [Deltaproteobacteria bacterium]|nr:hypothetical protein [Deltaproteobacteria bacterium]